MALFRPAQYRKGKPALQRQQHRAQQQRQIKETYDYCKDGKLRYQTVRYDPKDFRQRRPDGHGGWIWNLEGVERVMFRRDTVLAARKRVVLHFEGEKDVLQAEKDSLIATTTAQGARSWDKTAQDAREVLHDCDVVIVPDADDDGEYYALSAATGLYGVARSVKIVHLPGLEHRDKHGEDYSDWRNQGHTREELLQLIEAAPLWQPGVNQMVTGEPKPEPTWDEPVPLQSRLLPVMKLDPGIIPDAIRGWTMDIAHRMQGPLDFAVTTAIVVAAGLVGRRVGVCPKEKDDWTEPLNLWGMGIGLPSSMKTPIQQEVMKVVRWLQAGADKEFNEAATLYDAEQLIAKVERDVMIDQAKKAAKDGDKAQLNTLKDRLAELEKPAPVRTRYYTSDATIEKLGEILCDRPEGILIYRDELMGWLRNLDKQGRDGDRQFYLEAHSGKVRFPTDRISRGSSSPINCQSILGGIQPGPLSHYVHGAMSIEGEDSDGLLQRFNVTVWPDLAPFTYVDEFPKAEAKDKAYGVYRRLATADVVAEFGATPPDEHESDAIPFLHFDEDGQKVFVEWYTPLQQRLRSDDEIMSPALNAHLAKFPALMAELAALFHLMDVATEAAQPGPVSGIAAERAVKWCEYLESHARRMYASATNADVDRADNLLRHIRRGEVVDSTPLRDIYQHHWEGLTTRDEVDMAIKLLTDHSWVQTESQQPEIGRPSPVIRLHPSLTKYQNA